MSTDKGYIKLYRDVRDHWVWSDKDEPFDRAHAWIDLLMMVNHKDKKVLFNGRLITVKRGSRITSIRKLAERWGWSRHKVSDFLNALEQDNMISQERATQKTLINVINYSFYQASDSTKEPQKSHQRATQGPQKSHSGATEGHKQDIKKNEEGMKKKEEEYKPSAFTENDDTDEEEGWGYD